MKIAVLTSTFPPYQGGMGNVAFHEAKALAWLGHDVTVLTPRYAGAEIPRATTPPPFRVLRIPPRVQAGNGALCPDMVPLAAEAGAILLHYPFFGTAEWLWFKRSFGSRPALPRLILRYDMDVMGRGAKRWLFALHTRCIMPRLLRAADRVIFSTADYARTSHAAAFARDQAGKCAEIPYGADPDQYFPDPGAHRASRRILFVGGLDRAHYFKGLDRLLEAVVPLMTDDPATSLHVVGQGDLLPHYREVAQRLGITGNVTFLPACDNDSLRREYSEAAVTVLPSIDRSESFGLVLVESMACGTPILVSDLPGVRTLIHDGATGYLARNPEDKAAHILHLRDALREVVAHPDEAARRGQAGLRCVNERYAWRRIALSLQDILHRATAARLG